MLVDTHCHLADPAFATDAGEVVARAGAAGVGHVVVIGETPDRARQAVTLARNTPGLSATAGIHPHDARTWSDDAGRWLREAIRDPAVVAIGIVVRGDRCLLGRQRGWPGNMYSALAGFVEAGETLEEALRREVREEAGVAIGAVRYWRSQPWPFPSSLMLGCIADAESEAIRVDPAELEDARWFTQGEIRAALDGRPGPLSVPPAFSIAHQLLRAWIGGTLA